jgi:hypothetical protein
MEKSLSESALMGDIFTRSTMDILRQDKDFDFKTFFSPVVPMNNEEV